MSRRLTDQERVWRSIPESHVVRNVLGYVHALGGYAYRQNTGSGFFRNPGSDKERFVRFSEKGAADIVAVLPGCGAFFVECKDERGKQSDEQAAWQKAVERAGGRYLLVRPSTWQCVIDEARGVE